MPSDAATASAGGCGPAYGASRRAEPPAEVGPVRLGDAEQLADHGERQREREAGDEIDRAVGAARLEVVEQAVDDRPDPRLQRLRPAAA